MIRAVAWIDGKVRFLDQTRLPLSEEYVETDNPEVIAEAIRHLAVRGAPLIGVASAYGFALAVTHLRSGDSQDAGERINRAVALFSSTRPTAVNLFWALERMKSVALANISLPPSAFNARVVAEAVAIHRDDEERCERIARHGASILSQGSSVMTHCNTGALATGGKGTALAVIVTAWEQKKIKRVYIGETRPLFQGARLTAWELQRASIPAILIPDSAAAVVMRRGLVDALIVGADRIARNGDTANKLGTYALAVLARHHRIPFYVAAPLNTIDPAMADGEEIAIEEREAEEVTHFGGKRITPENVEVFAPSFDVTSHELITAIITEQGVHDPPFADSLPLPSK